MSDSTIVTIPDSAKGPDFEKHLAAAQADMEPPQPKPPGPDADLSPEAPTLLAGKFKTPADLEKAYKELEGKLGIQKPAEKKPEAKKEAKDGQPAQMTPEDLQVYETEFQESGALSEDSYKALAERGLSKAVVDAYIESRQAKANAEVQAVIDQIGGKEAYEAVRSWAAANLDADEIEQFNALCASGNTKAVAFTLKNLKARMEVATPTRVEGGKPGRGVVGFRNHHEMTKAIGDPRYQRDPDYTQEVVQRMAVTDFQ